MTLVILAAGMGSRFGGLKQIEPVHKNGEFILDYSIYDAIRNGFNKVVFIIKEENYDIFKETIGKRIEKVVEVKYVFQNNSNIPTSFTIPSDRVKPFGTAHAILCCKDVVDENFMIINADDFYGENAYAVAANYMRNMDDSNEFAMVGYSVGNTLTSNGSVKRGVCEEKDGFLTKIVESSVETLNDKILVKPLDGKDEFYVSADSLVSMNMFIFTPKIFKYLEDGMKIFLEVNNSDLSKCEYLIPEVVCNLILDGTVNVKILKTSSVWQGITYKEDKEKLVSGLNELVQQNVYPDKLW